MIYYRKKTILSAATCIALTLILIYLDSLQSTSPILDAEGHVLRDSIASLERIKLGGVDQSVLIRGENVAHPLLLFLHGGPGYSEMPLIRRFNKDLEKHFIVVNWDQRGTGKSFFIGMNSESISIKKILSDVREFVGILKSRFKKDKVFLMGHSWGTTLGLYAVQERPCDYYAYIGIGQVVAQWRATRLTYKYCRECAKREKHEIAWRELSAINLPDKGFTLSCHDAAVLHKWLHYFHGAFHKEKDIEHLNRVYYACEEYSPIDLARKKLGTALTLLLLQGELAKIDFFDAVRKVDVPVFFCSGCYDYQTPFALVEEYCDFIDAPHKEIIWFTESAHYPLFEEPDKFHFVMTHQILRYCQSSGGPESPL